MGRQGHAARERQSELQVTATKIRLQLACRHPENPLLLCEVIAAMDFFVVPTVTFDGS